MSTTIKDTLPKVPLSLTRHLVHKTLSKIKTGQLILSDPWGEYQFGQENSNFRVKLHICDLKTYQSICINGSLGFANAYIEQTLSTPHLTDLLRLFIKNRAVIDQTDSSLMNILTRVTNTFAYIMSRNTKRNAKKHIHLHYDLSNAFFEIILDPTMMYSGAIFDTPEDSLEAAQYKKLDTIVSQLDLKPHHHLVEIGSGWGGMAIHAAKKIGCKVTTTTISDEQFDYAKNRIQEEGLTDKISLLKEDYRNLKGQFDRLVSIEMIEAVGYQFYKNYFQTCNRLVKDDGNMLI